MFLICWWSNISIIPSREDLHRSDSKEITKALRVRLTRQYNVSGITVRFSWNGLVEQWRKRKLGVNVWEACSGWILFWHYNQQMRIRKNTCLNCVPREISIHEFCDTEMVPRTVIVHANNYKIWYVRGIYELQDKRLRLWAGVVQARVKLTLPSALIVFQRPIAADHIRNLIAASAPDYSVSFITCSLYGVKV